MFDFNKVNKIMPLTISFNQQAYLFKHNFIYHILIILNIIKTNQSPFLDFINDQNCTWFKVYRAVGIDAGTHSICLNPLL